MKSYTRKQMLTAKAKLKGARQERKRLKKLIKTIEMLNNEAVQKHRKEDIDLRKELNKTESLLRKANKRKWYQFKEVK